MKRPRTRITRSLITLAFLSSILGAALASPGRQALAGGPTVSAQWTPKGQIHVLGNYFSPKSVVQIDEFADGSSKAGAVHYASTDASGYFDTSFTQGVCAYSTDTIVVLDPIYGWSNPVNLPSVCYRPSEKE